MNESKKLWKTIERELLRVHDIELVVLKSHLLVETQINVALESRFGPDIEKVKLSFSQKLELLTCICPLLKDKDSSLGQRTLYEDWKELNKIRNKIAHHLSPENMRTLLIEWVTNALGYRLKTINRTVVLKRNIVKAIIFEVALFSGYIEGWRSCSNKALAADS